MEQSVTVEQGTWNEVEPHYARQTADCEQLISIILVGRRRLLPGATPIMEHGPGDWTSRMEAIIRHVAFDSFGNGTFFLLKNQIKDEKRRSFDEDLRTLPNAMPTGMPVGTHG